MKKSFTCLIFFMFTASICFAGSIEIKGSTTVLPIAQMVAESFMKEFPEINISISGGGSGNGIKALIDGTTDIADASRFITIKEVKRALNNNRYPVPFAVAYDCIIPVVNPLNPVKNLSIQELKDIYTGKIRNWKQVGGWDKRIAVISRDTSSGTYEVWEKKILHGARVYPGAQLQASNGAVAQAVASNKYAIGYIGLGYLNKELKQLKVNNILGTPASALDGSYPISRPLYMFTSGWPKGDVAKFINYVLNPYKGQKLVKKAGYIPLY